VLRRLRLALPLAFLAALLTAAAPVLARLHLAHGAPPTGEICSADGLKQLPPSEAPLSGASAGHCLLCLTAGTPAVIPAGSMPALVPSARHPLRATFAAPRRTVEAVRAARARGPPRPAVLEA
jgi:hypothetical protein